MKRFVARCNTLILPDHLAISSSLHFLGGDDHDHDDHDLHFLGGNLKIVAITIITTSWDPEKKDAGSISFKNVFKIWVAVDRSPI